MNINLFNITPLKGAFKLTQKPKLSLQALFSEDYQWKYDKYFNEHLGFRNNFIRLINQTSYFIFNKTNKPLLIIGENNVLFDKQYIDAMNGKYFIGSKTIEKTVSDIEFVTKKLNEINKELLIIIAPNKARYYEKNIPSYFQITDTSNYEIFKNELNLKTINYIDFNKCFISIKEQNGYNIIPKYGIHWSVYGSTLAQDSIINYCNTIFGYKLPKYKIDSIEYTKEPRDDDYDIGNILNLYSKLDDVTYLYPIRNVINNDSTEKKKLLVIADSYYNSIHRSGFSDDIYDLTGYWYYNKNIINDKKLSRKHINIGKTLENTDLIMIVTTEFNMYKFGFGIIEELEHYFNKKKYNRDLTETIYKIRENKEWFSDIVVQAKEREIPVDSMIIRAANYYIKNSK